MKSLLPLLLAASMIASEPVIGLELSSAFDGGFSVPSASRMAESSILYPGAESFTKGSFGMLGWSVPFGMEDMALTTIHGGYGFGRTAVSASFSSMGFDLYGEESVKTGFAYAPHKAVSIGARIARHAMRIKGFGDASAFSADLGIVLRPHTSVVIAASFEDIGEAELGNSREPVDGHYRIGGSWTASKRITLITALNKTQRFGLSVSGGFLANPAERLVLGVLGGTEPDRFEFLGGVTVSGFNFCYRGSHHRDLGMTHGWSIGLAASPLSQ